MAEAMILSSEKVQEMYPQSVNSYAAKNARAALSKGFKIAQIIDENFSSHLKDIKYLYQISQELLDLAFSPYEKVKMEYVVDFTLLRENKLILAFGTTPTGYFTTTY